MPRFICKFGEDQFLEWSTIVDAPVTYMMTKVEAVAAFGLDRVERADTNGTSILPAKSLESAIGGYNRAGEGESYLTIPEIIKQYTAGEAPQ